VGNSNIVGIYNITAIVARGITAIDMESIVGIHCAEGGESGCCCCEETHFDCSGEIDGEFGWWRKIEVVDEGEEYQYLE